MTTMTRQLKGLEKDLAAAAAEIGELCAKKPRLEEADLRSLRRRLRLLLALEREAKANGIDAGEAAAVGAEGKNRVALDLSPQGATQRFFAADFDGDWHLINDRTYFPRIVAEKGFRSSGAEPGGLAKGGPIAETGLEKTVSIDEAGRYQVWCRGLWGDGDRSWRLQVGGKKFPALFTNGDPSAHRWYWQKAGLVQIKAGEVALRITDTGRGWEGVDTIVFTKDAAYDPQLEEELLEERCLELAPPVRLPGVNERGRLTAKMQAMARDLPKFAPPKTLATWKKQQVKRREELRRFLGFDRLSRPAVEPKIVWEDSADGMTRRRIEFQSEDDVTLSCIVLSPKTSSPFPDHELRRKTVIALPGHPAGARVVAGLEPTDDEGNYGWELFRRGYVVVCPDTRGFGPQADLSAVTGYMGLVAGRPMLAMQAWDAIRCVDFVEQTGLADMDTLGVVGFGLGAGAAMLAAALDERIHVTVQSGHLFSWRNEIAQGRAFAHIHALIPGLTTEMDMGEIDSLIAPRALLLMRSRQAAGGLGGALEMAAQTHQVYDLCGAPERLKTHVFPGPDVMMTELAINWIDRWNG